MCAPNCRRCAADGDGTDGDGVVNGFDSGHPGQLREKMAWPGCDPPWFIGIDMILYVLCGVIFGYMVDDVIYRLYDKLYGLERTPN